MRFLKEGRIHKWDLFDREFLREIKMAKFCPHCQGVFIEKTVEEHIQKQHFNKNFRSNLFPPLVLDSEPNSNHSNLDLNRSLDHDVNENQTKEKSTGKDLWHICAYCEKQFMYYKTYTNHIRAKHASGQVEFKYTCNQCDKEYAQLHNLEEHVKSKHLNLRLKCPHCDNEYSSRSTLDVHIKAKHRGRKYECDKCDKVYVYKHELVHHVRSKHLGIRYNCDHCDKTFATKISLKDHIQSSHEKIKAFKCEECDLSYSRQSCLWVHNKRKH